MLTQIDTDGATVRTITALTQVDTDGSTIRTLQQLWQNDIDGTPRLIFSAGGGSGGGGLTPDEVSGYGYSKTAIPVTTDVATVAAPSGATIAWNLPTGWTATNPTSAMSAFRKTCGMGESFSASITATYTLGGHSTTTNAISAMVMNTYGA